MGSRSEAVEKFMSNPMKVNTLIGVIGLSFIILYSILTNFSEKPIEFLSISIGPAPIHAASVALKEMGLALLIAVILNFSIEGFNRHRHQKEKNELISAIKNSYEENKNALISELESQHKKQMEAVNKKIFQVVYQRKVPKSIFSEVEDLLLESRFIRKNSIFVYTIKNLDEDHVILDVRHRFVVVNVSNLAHEYVNKVGFDVLKSKSDKYAIRSISAGSKSITPSESDVTKEDRSPRHEWWVAQIGEVIQPSKSIECEVCYSRVSQKRGTEVITTRLPTERLEVRVIDPAQDFSFRVSSLHPKAEKNLSESGSPDKIHYHWEIDGTLLPGQGLLFDWVPNIDLDKALKNQ